MNNRTSAYSLRIGELAKKMACAVETIRFYEREGLIPPPERSTSNYRLYGPQHLERMRFIRRCRALDMSLDEIRALLTVEGTSDEQCCKVSALIEEHLHHVEARLVDLHALQKQLVDLKSKCNDEHTSRQCEILTILEDPAPLKGIKPEETSDSCRTGLNHGHTH